MQDFRDNEKKQLKMTDNLPFWILFLQETSYYILFYIHDPVFF